MPITAITMMTLSVFFLSYGVAEEKGRMWILLLAFGLCLGGAVLYDLTPELPCQTM